MRETGPGGFPAGSPLARAAADSWRDVRLDSLASPAIPEHLLAKLYAHTPPIATLDELTDHIEATTKDGEFWASGIEGVGKAGADKITAATDGYWATCWDYTVTDGEPDPEPDPPDDDSDDSEGD